ncbi:apolipoprotein N-acyltransferase [Desulfovibrio sp. MES5]|uniref:apolipoprotein N-acyltransferase n=1 Tax=Desulfovibrio sp. MES5 TaxID=1899016 RepID=UPI0025BB23E9|nr:apolipoprotein N-acyltransferase [Desulfovibrio sp. MES5]
MSRTQSMSPTLAPAFRPDSSALFTGIVGAAGIWLGFPNDLAGLPPLVLLWPMALAWLGLYAPTSGAALRRGWLSSLAGGMAALYWLSMPVHNVGGLPWLLAIPCALFIVACISSAGGLFAVAARLLRHRPPILWAVMLGLLWYVLEAVYALALGFPWLELSGALAAWPLLVQGADTVGAYGLSGLWVIAALLCALALLPHPAAPCPKAPSCKNGGKDGGKGSTEQGAEDIAAASDTPGNSGLGVKKSWRPASLVCGLAMTCLLLGYGALRLHQQPLNADPVGPQSVQALFVEGNVDQNQKWLPAFQRQTVDLYLRLTYDALAQRPGEHPLIIWPETALPFFFETNQLHSPRVRQLPAVTGSPLLVGAPGLERRADKKEPDVFNRAFLLTPPDGAVAGYYDKEHLVPFGEYLPEWLNWSFLEALLQGVGVYQTGTAIAPLRYGNLAMGMLICYEGIFPWLAQARVEDGANILVDISNDGWFGATPAPRQHLYLTALRAIEQNRWILRGTNTGISVVVDARGRLTMHGAQFREQALWGRAALESAPSLYHRLWPWPLPVAAALLGVLLLPGCRGRSRRNSDA